MRIDILLHAEHAAAVRMKPIDEVSSEKLLLDRKA
jgi:hypothetical protein